MCCSTTQLVASCISTSADAMGAIFRRVTHHPVTLLSAAATSHAQPLSLACQTPSSMGSTTLRSLSMCCSVTQLSASCISTSANAMEAIFRGQGYGIRCPRLGFLLAAASRAIGAAVQPPESKYRSSRAAPLVHSRSVPSTQCQHSSSNWGLVQPASTTLLRHALDKFCPWWRKFQCCLFDRCTLCHDPCGFMCVGLHRNKRVDLCCCLKVLRCASVGLQDLQSCPHAARVHRLRSTHRVRFLCGAAAKCVSHLHVHQPRETRDHARTFARARATHRSRLAPSSTYASASGVSSSSSLSSLPPWACTCNVGPSQAHLAATCSAWRDSRSRLLLRWSWPCV